MICYSGLSNQYLYLSYEMMGNSSHIKFARFSVLTLEDGLEIVFSEIGICVMEKYRVGSKQS